MRSKKWLMLITLFATACSAAVAAEPGNVGSLDAPVAPVERPNPTPSVSEPTATAEEPTAEPTVGQPATGSLLKGGLLAGRNRVPEFRNHRAAVDATGVQRRVGPPDGLLNLGILAEQTGPTTRCLCTGQLDQCVNTSPRNSCNHSAVVGSDPGL